jgi:DNA-binding transcriptional regulator YiaG
MPTRDDDASLEGVNLLRPDFCDEVRDLRDRLCMTEEQFCATYDIPLATLKFWEHPERHISPDTEARILIEMISSHPEVMVKIIARRRNQYRPS